jgi:hypothetical protein
MNDLFREIGGDFLDGQCVCVDRIALNAYFALAQGPTGFRAWWRRLSRIEENLDDTHQVRLAGRLGWRMPAFAPSPVAGHATNPQAKRFG